MADDENSRWERRTWPELKRLTEEVPEAGIHFQSMNTFPFILFLFIFFIMTNF
jgi:D-amino-acid oxidase